MCCRILGLALALFCFCVSSSFADIFAKVLFPEKSESGLKIEDIEFTDNQEPRILAATNQGVFASSTRLFELGFRPVKLFENIPVGHLVADTRAGFEDVFWYSYRSTAGTSAGMYRESHPLEPAESLGLPSDLGKIYGIETTTQSVWIASDEGVYFYNNASGPASFKSLGI